MAALMWLEAMVPGVVVQKIFVPLSAMLKYGIVMNIYLAAFNLIPIVPLDGGRIVAGLLPRELEMKYNRIEPYGLFIVIALIFLGLTRFFVIPLASLIYNIIMALLSLFIP